MTFPRPLALVAVLLPLYGCVYPAGDSRVFVTSDPPGADVMLDGEATGLTTPAILELGGACADDHRISVVKQGFEPEERRVTHYTRWRTSRWRDGAVEVGVWAFPMFWTFGDFFTPFEVRWAYVPHDLFVRLYPEGTFQRTDLSDERPPVSDK
jgi:hypothetical protein